LSASAKLVPAVGSRWPGSLWSRFCPGDNFPRVMPNFLTLWSTGEEGQAMNTFENHPGEKGDVPGWVDNPLDT